jgi:hypothetical protein
MQRGYSQDQLLRQRLALPEGGTGILFDVGVIGSGKFAVGLLDLVLSRARSSRLCSNL